MKTVLIWRFEPEDSKTLEAVKLTVASPKMGDIGTHARLTRQVTEQWRLETNNPEPPPPAAGVEAEPVVDKTTEEDRALFDTYMRWAVLMVCTRKVEVVKRTKTEKELDNETSGEWPWEPSSMEALEWDNPKHLLEVPTDFFMAWEQFCRRVSPGIFGPPLTAISTKKKTGPGLISVI